MGFGLWQSHQVLVQGLMLALLGLAPLCVPWGTHVQLVVALTLPANAIRHFPT